MLFFWHSIHLLKNRINIQHYTVLTKDHCSLRSEKLKRKTKKSSKITFKKNQFENVQ